MVALTLGVAAQPAAAGGSWLDPAKDRYEPGETATLVGYTGGGQLGWVEDGPFFGYLRVDPAAAVAQEQWPAIVPSDLPLGQLILQETGRGGYLSLRAAITFTLPADLPPGTYEFVYCNDPCTTGLGDLIGGTVWVGTDPGEPLSRDWPSDDPALRGAPASEPLPAPPPTTAPALTTTIPSMSLPTRSAPTAETRVAAGPTPTSAQRVIASGREGDSLLWPAAAGGIAVAALISATLHLRRRRRHPIVSAPAISPAFDEASEAEPRQPIEAGAPPR